MFRFTIRDVLWLMVVVGVFAACDTAKSPPRAASIATVNSLADASRRLELMGYRYQKETNALGLQFVTYEKKSQHGDFSVDIVRWSQDSRIKSLIFSCRTNEAAFNSKAIRGALWTAIDADICALVNGRDDYLRALAEMREVKGDGLDRFEGRATTAEGWGILAIEYVGYYKRQSDKNEKIAMAMVDLTHIATSANEPPAAAIEFERQTRAAKND